jgi:hypothetical protein
VPDPAVVLFHQMVKRANVALLGAKHHHYIYIRGVCLL